MDIIKIIALSLYGVNNDANTFEGRNEHIKQIYYDSAAVIVKALANNNLYITTIPKVD